MPVCFFGVKFTSTDDDGFECKTDNISSTIAGRIETMTTKFQLKLLFSLIFKSVGFRRSNHIPYIMPGSVRN